MPSTKDAGPNKTAVLSVELPYTLRIKLDMLRMMHRKERGERATLRAIFEAALKQFLVQERARLHTESPAILARLENQFGRLDELS